MNDQQLLYQLAKAVDGVDVDAVLGRDLCECSALVADAAKEVCTLGAKRFRSKHGKRATEETLRVFAGIVQGIHDRRAMVKRIQADPSILEAAKRAQADDQLANDPDGR